MRLDDLRKSLFGYKKADVYQLVSSMDEDFSKKLSAQEERSSQELETLRRRITELETELKYLKEENNSNSKNQMMISDALINAQAYAWQLKEESLKQEQAAQMKIREELQKKNEEIEVYGVKIRQLRECFQKLIKEFDEETERFEEKTVALKEEIPRLNVMPLFNRQPPKEKQG